MRRTAISLLLMAGMPCLSWAKDKPNIILFLVDDMGWTDCGAYGSRYYETPNVDRLAEQGMRFTDAYAAPLCSPCRASIMTGQEEARHGIMSAHGHLEPEPPGLQVLQENPPATQRFLLSKSKRYLDPDTVTLAEALRGAGYRTAHGGKWHLGLTQPHWPEAHGFETTFHCATDPGAAAGRCANVASTRRSRSMSRPEHCCSTGLSVQGGRATCSAAAKAVGSARSWIAGAHA